MTTLLKKKRASSVRSSTTSTPIPSTMIYLAVKPDEPIRQGDIFRGVPRVDFSLDNVQVVNADGTVSETRWRDITAGDAELSAIVGMRQVFGIVLTQDCDAIRSPDVTLAEVLPFKKVEKLLKDQQQGSVNWVRKIVQQAKINQKWYYLPQSSELGFTEAMGADFRSTLRVSRVDLEGLRDGFRIGRLNDVAAAHFRERIGEFFRRYAFDEWYPLTKEELEHYKKDHPDASPFNWQK